MFKIRPTNPTETREMGVGYILEFEKRSTQKKERFFVKESDIHPYPYPHHLVTYQIQQEPQDFPFESQEEAEKMLSTPNATLTTKCFPLEKKFRGQGRLRREFFNLTWRVLREDDDTRRTILHQCIKHFPGASIILKDDF